MTQIENFFRNVRRRHVESSTIRHRRAVRGWERIRRGLHRERLRPFRQWALFNRDQRRQRFIASANRYFRPATMAVYENPRLMENIMSYVRPPMYPQLN